LFIEMSMAKNPEPTNSVVYSINIAGKRRLVSSEVMTEQQYVAAEDDLVARLQTMRENESGGHSLIPKTGSGDDGSDALDDEYDQPISSEHQAAFNEWMQYCRIVKAYRKFPKQFKKEGLLEIGEIKFGIVEERGEDLDASHPFKKCNLADFIDGTGYFDLVKFVSFNRESFPFIYKLVCCLSAMRMNEVGCERFFSIAGYVSNPRRTRLKVRHYEALAMLKRNMQKVYIDEDWVVQQYMTMEKDKSWDAMDTHNDKLVAALEQELYADDVGVPMESVPIDEGEGEVMTGVGVSEPIDVPDSDDSSEPDSPDSDG
jgi:hypothetical protein